MNSKVGNIQSRTTGPTTVFRARARAALLPELLVDAARIANSVYSGWHGRRKRGIGENFWQFRHYVPGEPMANIDWRRSAIDDELFVRDREWQAAHTIWFWVDESPSMLFQSVQAQVSKQSRALVLAFALGELLARSGERIGWLGRSNAIASRNAVEILAANLFSSPPQTSIPKSTRLNSFAEVILIGDFLDNLESTAKTIHHLARRGIRGYLLQIIDPAEESFPYNGRIEFRDPETGNSFITGNAMAIGKAYKTLFAARTKSLERIASEQGWQHITHHTDKPASQALISLFTRLSGDRAFMPAAKSGNTQWSA